MYTEYKEAFSN